MNVQTEIEPQSSSCEEPIDAALANEAAPTPANGSPLRVLLIVESSGAGTGRHVLDLAGGLARRGIDTHIIYSTGRVEEIFLNRLSALKNVRSFPMAMRTIPHPSDPGVVLRVKRYMREFGPFDVIHGHSSKGGAIARLAAMGTRAAAFYTPHGLVLMDPLLARWKRLVYFGVERGLALRTARIIAVSPEEERATLQFGFSPSRVMLIPNGIEELTLTPRQEARRVMGVSDEMTVIGFVGRLVEQKAPDVLIKAFAAALKVSPNIRLAMVGSGPMDKALREIAASLRVTDKVIWLGARDARGVLAGFDLFALASRKEGLPYVVLEAMSVGLPIVATTSAGIEILVIPGENGEVVPTDDVGAFAHALTSLTSDPRRMAACAQSSRERSLKFSIDGMVEATIAAYEGAMPYALTTTGTQESAQVACEIG